MFPLVSESVLLSWFGFAFLYFRVKWSNILMHGSYLCCIIYFLRACKNPFSFFCLCDKRCQKKSKFWNAIWEILTVNNCAYFPPNCKEVNVAVYISFRICSLLLLFDFNKHFEGGSCHIFLFLPPQKTSQKAKNWGEKKKVRTFVKPTK